MSIFPGTTEPASVPATQPDGDGGGFSQGEKFKVIGTAEQIDRIRQILKLTLWGPNENLMRKWHIPHQEMIRQLAISNHFAPKKEGCPAIEVDDWVEFISFKDGKTELKGLHIEVEESNCFSISYRGDSQVIDLIFMNDRNLQWKSRQVLHSDSKGLPSDNLL